MKEGKKEDLKRRAEEATLTFFRRRQEKMGKKKKAGPPAATAKKESTPALNLGGGPPEEAKIVRASELFKVESAEQGYAIVEKRDTAQIIAEVEGGVADEMVYSFTVSGQKVNGLTYKGICELVRIMQGIRADVISCDPAVWFEEEGFVALARSVDLVTGTGSSVIFFQPRWMQKKDGKKAINRFASIIAQSKGKRNAASDILPLSLKRIVIQAALGSKGPDAMPIDKILATRREQQIEASRQRALTSDSIIRGQVARKIFAQWAIAYKEACKQGQIDYDEKKQVEAFNRFLLAGWELDRARGASSKDLTVGQLEEALLIVSKNEVDFLTGELLPGAMEDAKKFTKSLKT